MTAVATENERIIRRFIPVITNLAPLKLRGDLVGVYCDVEATGKDPEKDHIVQLSIVEFCFTANGAVTGIGAAHTWLEDPGVPIPPEVTNVHGITDDMVYRKRIVDGAVNELVAKAEIVVAHNSDYDRKILERRLPIFERARWGCSYRDIPWRDEGYECAKLRCLLLESCALDFDNHDASGDTYAGLHLLTTTLPSGMRALACVLDAIRVSHVRVYAIGSPFPYKDTLKDRGYKWDDEYKWHNGKKEKAGVWYRDVKVGDDYTAEVEWLASNAMCHSPKSVQFDSRKRFSNRIGK